MKLVNQLLEEMHVARACLQHKKPEPVKLAVYINHSTWNKLCRELHQGQYYRTDVSLGGIPRDKDKIWGYPCYEVHGQDKIPWNIVEVFNVSDIQYSP